MTHTGDRTMSPAMVISLDFELHWGVRDHLRTDGHYRANLMGARAVVPQLLRLFERYEISATWATVGMLFAKGRTDLESFAPRLRPGYHRTALDAYAEPLGDSEAADPLHFAPSLIDSIAATPRQEIATHTFSHYYALESGQDRDAFRADLEAALALSRRDDIPITSCVFPRNQFNPDYLKVLHDLGITAYRGPQRGWMHEPRAVGFKHPARRLGRLADAYFPLSGVHHTAWSDVSRNGAPYNVPGSCFLRPAGSRISTPERVRLCRIRRTMAHAARTGGLFHLWWHPHNFGTRTANNLRFLEAILKAFRKLHLELGMQSLSMRDVAAIASRHRQSGFFFEPPGFRYTIRTQSC